MDTNIGSRAAESPSPPPPRGGAAPREPSPPRVRQANRTQVLLRALDLEGMLPEDHRARVVWAYVEGLDLTPLYQEIQAGGGGGRGWRAGAGQRRGRLVPPPANAGGLPGRGRGAGPGAPGGSGRGPGGGEPAPAGGPRARPPAAR